MQFHLRSLNIFKIFFYALPLLLVLNPQAKTLVFQPDTSDFPNPERGFYIQGNISQSTIQKARTDFNATVIRTYFRLDSYVHSPLPQSFLDGLERNFQIVRNSGAKVIPRFSYNFGFEGTDAPEAQILEHIDQLAPILAKNHDVIVHLNAGFIGAWGEWHASDFDLDNTISRRNIHLKLLSVLPSSRMVNLRYNGHKRDIFATDISLSKDSAFQGSPRSRTGALNDCLGASEDNWGTYSDDIESDKEYLSTDNRFVVQEGETCNPDPIYSTCDTMLKDLQRMRWDLLNRDYHQGVLQSWVDGGCMPEIQRKLGYRLRLVQGEFDDTVSDGNLDVKLQIVNEGWGKVFNPRAFEIILRDSQTLAEHKIDLKQDPRFWGPGETINLNLKVAIPPTVPFGNYQLFLHLPDPHPNLYGRPEYSLRFANQGLWESSIGYHNLGHQVKINSHSSEVNATLPKFSSRLPMSHAFSSNGIIEITFDLSHTANVSATLTTISGKHIHTFLAGNYPSGKHSIQWNPKLTQASKLPQGQYVVQLKINQEHQVHKVIVSD